MRLALRTFFFFFLIMVNFPLTLGNSESLYFALFLVMGGLKLTEERPSLRSYPNNKCNFIVPLELNITF